MRVDEMYPGFEEWATDAPHLLIQRASMSVDLLEGPGTPPGALVGRTVIAVVPDFAMDLGNLTLVLDDGTRIECTDDTDWEPWHFRGDGHDWGA